MIKDVQQVQTEFESRFIADQAKIDEAALALYSQAPRLAIDYLTDYSVTSGDSVVQRWRELGEFLLYKYLDGNVKNEHGKVTHPGYAESWYRRVVDSAGERLQMKQIEPERIAAAAEEKAASAKRLDLAEGIFALLKSRNLVVEDAERQKILECQDIGELQRWLIRAATVEKGSELFVGM
jgi:hypothetical protein